MLCYGILFASLPQCWKTGALVLTGVSLALPLALMMQFAVQPSQCMVLSGDGFFSNVVFTLPLFFTGRSKSPNYWSMAGSQQ